MNATVDLTNCELEPIRTPGLIQPHGLLFVVEPKSFTVVQYSANAAALLRAGESIEGVSLAMLLGEPAAFALRSATASDEPIPRPRYLGLFSIPRAAGPFDVMYHRSDGWLIVELEPHEVPARNAPPVLNGVQRSFDALREAGSLQAMLDVCADAVRELTGFDRVMVYRFDEEWNGSVVAEAKRGDLEPFRGLHYPASDIPAQARELYRVNWLRFIADRDYTASPLLPPRGASLDMSHCVLRSVSPIHLQYLRNMGVGASMSISLLRGDRLWALIACHHYSPRRVPFDVRTSAELFGQVMSLQFAAREESETAQLALTFREQVVQLVAQVDTGDALAVSLLERDTSLLQLYGASGVAIISDDTVSRAGHAPSPQLVLAIADAMSAALAGEIVHTDHLSKFLQAGALGNVAAGVMMATFSQTKRYRILWFRPEQIRTVNWAGDPRKSLAKGEPETARLSPRGSFALWQDTIRGRSLEWTPDVIASARELRAGLIARLAEVAADLTVDNRRLRGVEASANRQLSDERAAREEAERLTHTKDDFIATLSHELRTPLNAILGWSQLLSRSNSSDAEIDEGLGVIERNARAQAQLIEDLLDMSRITSGKVRLDVQPVDLHEVVRAAIDTVRVAADAKEVQLRQMLDPLGGVSISGDPQRLQQVACNLLGNAIKFTPRGGRVDIVLRRVHSHIELSVADTGEGISSDFLPHVFERLRQAENSPQRRHGGLGLGLAISRHLIELHGGTIVADSAGLGKGSTFVVTLPVRAVASSDRGAHPRAAEAAGDVARGAVDLSGVRVLVVDDEPDARRIVTTILGRSGATVETASSANEAVGYFSSASFDVLISDIGMPGEDGYALIRRVRRLEQKTGKPKTAAVALTAYARAEDRRKIMMSDFQVHVAKPVDAAELLAVVANLARRV